MSSLIESIITSIQNNIAFALIALGVLIVIYMLSLAIIFKKIGHKALVAFIPIYNIMSLLTILNIPQWMVLIMFIPFVNILGFPLMMFIIGYKLGTLCRKNILMKIGLMVLPPVFYPVLAFTEIDVDGSKLKYVVEPVKKVEFKLDPVEIVTDIEVPEAMSLADSATLDKITIKKIKPVVEKKEVSVPTTSIAEHLAKADKEKPTAQDLTFDYNLIYNSKETKEDKVKEIVEKVEEVTTEPIKVNDKLEKKEETIEESVEDTPIVPIVHEVILEEATPIDNAMAGPVPINQRYDNQMNANKQQIEKKKELERTKEKEKEEEIIQIMEPTIILDNGPVNIDSSLAGLMAAAPDFNTPVKKTAKEEIEVKEETKKDNLPTTEIQEIVSMNIIEPSQMPVGVNPNKEEKEEKNDNITEPKEEKIEPNKVQEPLPQSSSQLLRPVMSPSSAHVQVDKVCPQCNAKMKRDCPVCIMCGYRFGD